MKTINLKNSLMTITLSLFTCLLIFNSCKKDNASSSALTAIKVTDSPIDDASVSGAFVTIADIKLDGQSVQGFSKATIDILAYQNGLTKTIGNFNLEGRAYNTVTFVLDFDTDATGNTPGCYVLSNGSVKHKLQSTTNIIIVSKNLTLQSGVSNSIVADFDLRKMIIYQSGGAGDQYDFATAAELTTSVRVMTEKNAGTISGTVTGTFSGAGKVVAYAYKKGTFNRSTEMLGQGASNIQFKNAVSSSLVSTGTGNYQLHFLESGDYEIHFASYSDINSDGKFILTGTVVVTGTAGIDLLNLNLNANTTLTANVIASGLLP